MPAPALGYFPQGYFAGYWPARYWPDWGEEVLARGVVTVTFSAQAPSITFEARVPEVSFSPGPSETTE